MFFYKKFLILVFLNILLLSNLSASQFYVTESELPLMDNFDSDKLIVDFSYSVDDFLISTEQYYDQNNKLREVSVLETHLLSEILGEVGDPIKLVEIYDQILPLGYVVEDFDVYFYNPFVLDLKNIVRPNLPIYTANQKQIFNNSKTILFNDSLYDSKNYPENKIIKQTNYFERELPFFSVIVSPISFDFVEKKATVHNMRIVLNLKKTQAQRINLAYDFQLFYYNIYKSQKENIKKNVVDLDLFEEHILHKNPYVFPRLDPNFNKSDSDDLQEIEFSFNFDESDFIFETIEINSQEFCLPVSKSDVFRKFGFAGNPLILSLIKPFVLPDYTEIVKIQVSTSNSRLLKTDCYLSPHSLFSPNDTLNYLNYTQSDYPKRKLLDYRVYNQLGFKILDLYVTPFSFNGQNKTYSLNDLKIVLTLKKSKFGSKEEPFFLKENQDRILEYINKNSNFGPHKIEVKPNLDEVVGSYLSFNNTPLDNEVEFLFCSYTELGPGCEPEIFLEEKNTDYPYGLSVFELSNEDGAGLSFDYVNDLDFVENTAAIENNSLSFNKTNKLHYFVYYSKDQLSKENYDKLTLDLSNNLSSEKKYVASLKNYSNNQSYCFGEFISENNNKINHFNTSCFSNQSEGYFYVFVFTFQIEKSRFFGLFKSNHVNYFFNTQNQLIQTENYFEKNNNFIKHNIFSMHKSISKTDLACTDDVCFNDFDLFSLYFNDNKDFFEKENSTVYDLDIKYDNYDVTKVNGLKTNILDLEKIASQKTTVKITSIDSFTKNTLFFVFDAEKVPYIDLGYLSDLDYTLYSQHNLPYLSSQSLNEGYLAFNLPSNLNEVSLNIDKSIKNLSFLIINPSQKKASSFNLLLLNQEDRMKYYLYLTNLNILQHYCSNCSFFIYGVPNIAEKSENTFKFNENLSCLAPNGQEILGQTGLDNFNSYGFSNLLYTWDFDKIKHNTCDFGSYFCDADQLKTAFSKKLTLINNKSYVDLDGVYYEVNKDKEIVAFDNSVNLELFSIKSLENAFVNNYLASLDDYLLRSEEVLKYNFNIPAEYYSFSVFNLENNSLSSSVFNNIFKEHISVYNFSKNSSKYQFTIKEYIDNYSKIKNLISTSKNKSNLEKYLFDLSDFYVGYDFYNSDKIINVNGLNYFLIFTNSDVFSEQFRSIFSSVRFLDFDYSFSFVDKESNKSKIYLFTINDFDHAKKTAKYSVDGVLEHITYQNTILSKDNLLNNSLNARTYNYGSLVSNGFEFTNNYESVNFDSDLFSNGFLLTVSKDSVKHYDNLPLVLLVKESVNYKPNLFINGEEQKLAKNSWLISTENYFLKTKELTNDFGDYFNLSFSNNDVLARTIFYLPNKPNTLLEIFSNNMLYSSNQNLLLKTINNEYLSVFDLRDPQPSLSLEDILYGVKTKKICFDISEDKISFWQNLSNHDQLSLLELDSLYSFVQEIKEKDDVSFDELKESLIFSKSNYQKILFFYQNKLMLRTFYLTEKTSTDFKSLLDTKDEITLSYDLEKNKKTSVNEFAFLKEVSNNLFSSNYVVLNSDYSKNTLIVDSQKDLFLIPGTIVLLKFNNSEKIIPLLSVGNINNDQYVAYIKNDSLVFETLDKAINESLLLENKITNKLEKASYFYVHFSNIKLLDLFSREINLSENDGFVNILDYLVFSKN